MKLTILDIELYRKITHKINMLVKAYYDEFIYCNSSYQLHNWEILDDNQIRINYSCIDYNGNSYHDDTTISLDELNGGNDWIK